MRDCGRPEGGLRWRHTLVREEMAYGKPGEAGFVCGGAAGGVDGRSAAGDGDGAGHAAGARWGGMDYGAAWDGRAVRAGAAVVLEHDAAAAVLCRVSASRAGAVDVCVRGGAVAARDRGDSGRRGADEQADRVVGCGGGSGAVGGGSRPVAAVSQCADGNGDGGVCLCAGRDGSGVALHAAAGRGGPGVPAGGGCRESGVLGGAGEGSGGVAGVAAVLGVARGR